MANQLYDGHDVVTHVHRLAPIVLHQARLYNFQIVTNAFDHIMFYFSLIITLVIPMANTEACVLTLAGATPLF